MSFSKIHLDLGLRSYDVHIGSNIMGAVDSFLPEAYARKAFIISDRSLTKARRSLRENLKRRGWEVTEIAVAAGEPLKDFKNIYPIYGKLLEAKAHRDAVVFALGGGSVGDAAGFIASTYLRGVPWVGVPTTLLAQVDSSVGGKTAVNHSAGKNLIGTFHQPASVICDVSFLATLSDREIISGLGEAVKYGLIYDLDFFNFLSREWTQALKRNSRTLIEIVGKSVAWKVKTVASDEFDRSGVREFLNFGHTFGHALENITRYKIFQHGEAIIWGMRFALALSFVRRKLSLPDYHMADDFLRAIPVPKVSKSDRSKIIGAMAYDKKIRQGKLHFVLLKSIGQAVSDSKIGKGDLVAAFNLLMERTAGR